MAKSAAGRLNRRITLQERGTGYDDYGQPSDAWADVATVWANIKPISGREKLAAMAVDVQTSQTVMIRYNPDYLPATKVTGWRIKYQDRTLSITGAIDLDEAHKYIVFDCIEGADHG